VTSSRAVVAAIALVVVVAAVDGVRNGVSDRQRSVVPARDGFRIDLDSSRDGTSVPVQRLLRAFPGDTPDRVAVSKVAVAPDDVVAVGLSYVPGDRTSRAAIELWEGGRLASAFPVTVGSFSLGLWFTEDADVIATIGWDERAHVYDRAGRLLGDDAYFAYETR
jgi:hypothetical protein